MTIYTDPDGKRWEILEDGIPRKVIRGEHFITTDGDIHKGYTVFISTIVAPITPKRLVFEIEHRPPKQGEHYLNEGSIILAACSTTYNIERDVLILIEGDLDD